MHNTLKSIALSIVLALPATIPSLSHAQPGDGPRGEMRGGTKGERRGEGRGRRRGNPMARMMRMAERELKLSAAQKTRVQALGSEFEAKRRSISQSTTLSPEQKRAQMRPMRSAYEARFKAILTPAQRAKLPALQAKMREQMRQRMMDGRMGGRRGEGLNGVPKPR